MTGLLALVGGDAWTEACRGFDAELLAASGGTEVVVLPTAAAFEHPDRAVADATAHFAALGGTVRPLMVLARPDALDPANAETLRRARFIYLGGSSPMHLRSVLKDSPAWEALDAAWHDGAVVAASSAGAMALGDPMVDPRGGAFTVGLGLVEQLAVVAQANRWSEERHRRTVKLAPPDLPLLAIDEHTAAIRSANGSWRAAGEGKVTVFRAGVEIPLAEFHL